jgi:hypothetical protein
MNFKLIHFSLKKRKKIRRSKNGGIKSQAHMRVNSKKAKKNRVK